LFITLENLCRLKKVSAFLFAALLITGCSQTAYTREVSNKTKTFNIEQESKYGWDAERAEKRADLNRMRFNYTQQIEEKERIMRSKARYWTRKIDNKEYIGYDEELDKEGNLY